ncbi:hypothetical protein ACQPW3_05965 [Actinosynnema sp. CA-248983]
MKRFRLRAAVSGLLAVLALALVQPPPALAVLSPAGGSAGLSAGRAAGGAAGLSAGRAAGGAATFGVRPATAQAPDTRNNFSYSATPGAVVRDHVAVSNVSNDPVSLHVYASDAFNTPTAGSTCSRRARTRSTSAGGPCWTPPRCTSRRAAR